MDSQIIRNKNAYFNYNIVEKFEAGIVLTGNEVKSVRSKNVSIEEAFIRTDLKGAWIFGMHINPWKFSGKIDDYDPVKPRKLLLHKKEIKEIANAQKIKGVTIIPLKLFLKRGKIKLDIGLGKGLKRFDKRQKEREKEQKLSINSQNPNRW